MIEFEGGMIQISAEEVARGLGMTPADVMLGIRQGQITSICEAGVGEDAGRHRLTFFSPTRRLRLTVNSHGKVIRQSCANIRRKKGGSPPADAPRGRDAAQANGVDQ
ncbi:DUF6522 family protein [Phaeovulum sp.]|uniref:DUF6522 family protein n=1 Tax=Phaeovulum sp. TaxID=2934796 RepID=UPI003569FFDC